jgi:ATP/maltotriose-dependent transcriptional regulator MalT
VPAALLETKFYVPRPRRGLVPRPRLSERLDRGAASRLTLVSAPAGFGKTTLLTEWLAAGPAAPAGERLAAWLSLDRGDNDPASFWAYVIAALRTVAAGQARVRWHFCGRRSGLRSIAALQLAALSMRGRDDIASFAGDDRYVVDYLAEEVLARQSDRVQAFLLQTSILGRLSGPLCDAVTGQGGGKAMLEALDRANLFLVPLDDRRRWYRYHHLFADVL